MTSRYSGCTLRARMARVASGEAHGHHDGFGGAGGAVVHGGVGDLHAGELADHGLELEDGLQGALGDLRLIGRVGGEPLAARDERIDDHGAVVVVGAGAEKDVIAGAVLGGAGAEPVDDFASRPSGAGWSRSRLRRNSAGMCEKSSSMERTPISRSMSARSAGDLGR